jgi:predicted PurR-regulated permease PerM
MFIIAPASIIAILQGNVFAGIGLLVYGIVVVGLLDNILRPFVVGRGTDAHPAVILVGTIGGLALFGISGFLLGPLLLSLLGPVLDVWAQEQSVTHQVL